jgi:hypothetical protein
MSTNVYTDELGHGLINAGTALAVATSLNNTAAATPLLMQAGGPISEHRFSSSDTLGSGCGTNTGTYCSVWLRNNYSGQERYLPYISANQQGLSGWTWRGSILQNGEWDIRSVQGENRSTSYALSSK